MNSGIILVIFALLFSCASLVFYLRSHFVKGKPSAGRNLYYGATMIIGLAFATLLAAFLNNEFQYAYVYENSSRELGVLFRISALWAGREGSCLLWVFLISLLGLVLVHKGGEDEPLLAGVVLIFQIFLLSLMIFDSPFRFIWQAFPGSIQPGQVPPDGEGLHPLLQDFWMSIHPPVLFIGYASAIMPAAYAVTSLVKNTGPSWVDRSRRWVLFSVLSLGLGNILGAVWAYSVLGWGGYWAWDPVENSSLIPWLVILILMHTMIIQRKRGSLPRLNLALALLYPVMVFIGTYLTRSGILSDFSIHSFTAYGLSKVLLGFIILLIAVSTTLVVRSWKKTGGTPLGQDINTWDNLLLLGMISLGIFTAMVLVLTLMPVITGLIARHRSSTTSEIYNLMALPFACLILFFTILSSLKLSSFRKNRIAFAATAILSVGLGILFNMFGAIPTVKRLTSMLLCAEAFFLIAVCIYDIVVRRNISFFSSRLSHAGLAIFLLGAVASGFYSASEKKEMAKDLRENILDRTITFLGFQEGDKSGLVFRIETDTSMKEYFSAYYISPKTNSLVRKPIVLHSFIHDTYIVSEEYRSGFSRTCVTRLEKGEQTTMGNMAIRFINFRVQGMGTEKPVVLIDLEINGKKIAPGLAFNAEGTTQIIKDIPGTDRKVAVQDIDPTNGVVELFLIPGRTTTIPQDTVIVDVSNKRLISLVWLGCFILSAGILAGFFPVKRNSNG